MCLTLKESFKTIKEAKAALRNPLIAEKDIFVYKFLRESGFGKDRTYWAPIRSNFQFEKGQHYYQEGLIFTKKVYTENNHPVTYRAVINRGLHACITRKIAKSKGDNYKVVRMVVPKGSKYFLGRNGDIISDNLIWY